MLPTKASTVPSPHEAPIADNTEKDSGVRAIVYFTQSTRVPADKSSVKRAETVIIPRHLSNGIQKKSPSSLVAAPRVSGSFSLSWALLSRPSAFLAVPSSCSPLTPAWPAPGCSAVQASGCQRTRTSRKSTAVLVEAIQEKQVDQRVSGLRVLRPSRPSTPGAGGPTIAGDDARARTLSLSLNGKNHSCWTPSGSACFGCLSCPMCRASK